ncbi:Type IV leader peptidase family protein [Rosistilla oblonga]|uniref:prepilin peptidase n=1 Tax=Rosistilla oblonga TaxID=2527990 RepID=UPI00118ACAA1|nr:prepilin peptidase [Rosistilla oblonga]QDV12601.1 Type IV leader peptidase family protein [Rosistilla oblonga]
MTIGESLLWWLPAMACGVAVYHDVRTREIPDWLPIMLVVLVPVRMVVAGSVGAWWQHLAGGLLALAIGLLIGRGDRFGGGDIKLFAAIVLWFGLMSLVPLALWIAIAGLPFAVLAAAKEQQDFAYAPAILVGVCVYSIAPDLLQRIMG